MELFLYWLSGAVLLALAFWLQALYGQSRSTAAICALLVTLGLVYDNCTIAAGTLIGEGPLLEALNWPRYVIHALATPLLIIVSLDLGRHAGISWMTGRSGGAFLVLLTLAMIAYGVVVELLPLTLEASFEDGILSYSPAGEVGPPVPAMVTMVVLAVTGLALTFRHRYPWLTAGALLAFAGFGLAPVLEFDVLGQIAEVVLIGGIALTEVWLLSGSAVTRTVRPAARPQ